MRKRVEEIKSVEKLIITCDDYAKESEQWKRLYSSHTCCMCRKDLCDSHIKNSSYDSYGDHPPTYCADCLDIGKPYIDDMNKLEKEYEEKCELLTNEWRKKCLERRANAKTNFV